MPKGAYTLIRRIYNRYWEEEDIEIATGSIMEQGERLFEGMKDKLGPKDISLTLVDKEKNVVLKHPE